MQENGKTLTRTVRRFRLFAFGWREEKEEFVPMEHCVCEGMGWYAGKDSNGTHRRVNLGPFGYPGVINHDGVVGKWCRVQTEMEARYPGVKHP